MAKRVLITGASGFIGRHCVPHLVERGFEVHAVSLRSRPPEAEVRWHTVDLLDEGQIGRVLDDVRPTYLLHLAWVTEPGRYQRSEDNLRWVQASLSLLRGLQRAGGQRVVMAGSCAEYDQRYGYCSEGVTPLAPVTPYGVCKHATQLMLAAFSELAGLSSAWGRVFSVYGPHEHPERLVASVARALLGGREALCTAGVQVRDYLYVEDAATAFVALLDSGVTGPVNIASGRGIVVRDLVQTLGEVCGRTELVRLGALSTRGDEPLVIFGDSGRLRSTVGWAPRWELRAGLEETVRWWLGARRASGRDDSAIDR
ncbi:MAG: epimerase [Acidobacteria bacterium 21-70-11]|nr:MAG: epimerase [Acidobacteria bacterium 21-70-11]HQT93679.1 NAD(P)-dependent oxidoreductase [Thermoanaerobaculaceae bacterium]HQU32732.1 NAD(P)-dependent oxidoreductase [Thermoanaerobaculaceae bacterium]